MRQLVVVAVCSSLILIYEAALYVIYEWCNSALRCLHLDASVISSDKEWVKDDVSCIYAFIRGR
jgi:hypothetical protein